MLPYEIYELGKSVTASKVTGLILNLAILLYLIIVHRLFGVRGGARALRAEYEAERPPRLRPEHPAAGHRRCAASGMTAGSAGSEPYSYRHCR